MRVQETKQRGDLNGKSNNLKGKTHQANLSSRFSHQSTEIITPGNLMKKKIQNVPPLLFMFTVLQRFK